MSYNGYKNWDTWETMMILENDEGTYKWLKSWGVNFGRKMKAGTFSKVQAETVVEKYLIPVARGKGRAKDFRGLSTDPDIDPKKVDKAEIVNIIIKEYVPEEYKREAKKRNSSGKITWRKIPKGVVWDIWENINLNGWTFRIIHNKHDKGEYELSAYKGHRALYESGSSTGRRFKTLTEAKKKAEELYKENK